MCEGFRCFSSATVVAYLRSEIVGSFCEFHAEHAIAVGTADRFEKDPEEG